MKPTFVPALPTLLLLACFLLPISAHAQPAAPVSTPPGSAERIARMEAELKAMQAEAAKDPSRPSLAELRHQLDQMVAARQAGTPRDAISPLPWLTALSILLNVALALGLARLVLRRRPRTGPPLA